MVIKILLVDDHAMFRSGLKALLESEKDLEVVGEAADGDEGVDRVRELKPDVVVMDLSMPGTNGLDATRRITALGLKAQVLVLTVHAEEEYLVPVVEAGASGYLTKTSADQDLVEAIHRATRLLLQQYRNAHPEAAEGLRKLSAREREVMGGGRPRRGLPRALTAEGFSSREIGEKLFVSPKTVDTYRARIMEKLGLNHRSELVRFALKTGLLKDV